MADSTTADPDFRARIEKSFARQGFMGHLGIEIAALSPGRCELRVARQPGLLQQHGFFHYVVMATLADRDVGYVGYSLMGPDASVLTVEFKMNIVAPGDGEALIARGEAVRSGRTLTITKADVFAIKDGAEKLCATMLQTLMRMAGKPERDPDGQA